ncbi:SDR family NAD(P)-dependent oxidoreductase [Zhongshania aliphaticivorans]|uniref:SDR family NAD(P)-dependent oxidoreductase n=1 Tax=Zhongshania aliphaticivorans TaxID=1470434 RepID=UPI0012E5FF3B|nr:SDR family NAD(P)-dependent oxidoreductase [Zhongshania aliphaticivorans]CAA0120487.1 putative oxidoreductase [Zhongshania aliphaticivorans]
MSKDFCNLYGPWALITGASSGIGEAFAHAIAARGVNVILLARREEELYRVRADVVAKHGVECETLVVDLAVPSFIDQVEVFLGDRELGLVVSNAGYNPIGSFEDIDREAVLRILDVNDRAPLLLAQSFLPGLAKRGRGGFLIVGSIEGFNGTPWSAVYSASKAFVQSLGEALWGEYRKRGVDVLVLSPGATDTPILRAREVEVPGIMTPAAVAEYGLKHLGNGPCAIPGLSNRMILGVLKFMPRKLVSKAMGKALRAVVERSKI